MIFPIPGTTLLGGTFGSALPFSGALAVVDAATGRFVAMRDFAQEPLPPGRIAHRPTEPQQSAPYRSGGTAAASQGGSLMALTTSIAQQVTLPDGRRGWVQTRAVDVWTLDGPRLRLLRTIPIGGYADQRPALLVMERDGRHALVGVREVQFVNEVGGSAISISRARPRRGCCAWTSWPAASSRRPRPWSQGASAGSLRSWTWRSTRGAVSWRSATARAASGAVRTV
jgi:hypothetical protein